MDYAVAVVNRMPDGSPRLCLRPIRADRNSGTLEPGTDWAVWPTWMEDMKSSGLLSESLYDRFDSSGEIDRIDPSEVPGILAELESCKAATAARLAAERQDRARAFRAAILASGEALYRKVGDKYEAV